MITKKLLISSAITALVLIGCGGGGSSSSATTGYNVNLITIFHTNFFTQKQLSLYTFKDL